jgi:hypothetical protein
MPEYYVSNASMHERASIANPSTTNHVRFAPIGAGSVPFGVGLGLFAGSIAPMTNRGGVVGQCPGPIARRIVNRGGVDVVSENSPLFKPRFL